LNWDSLSSSLPILCDEAGDGSVECPFHFPGKKASGKFSKSLVISNALTTSPLFIARFVSAETILLVALEIAFHHGPLLLSIIAALRNPVPEGIFPDIYTI